MTAHNHQHSHFDIDQSRLIIQPKMFWAIIMGGCIAAFGIGGLVYQTHSRIANVETSIHDMRDEIRADRQSAQTRAQAYIDCLEAERSNRGFRCPMAKDVAQAAPPAAKPKVKRTTESSMAWWPSFGNAQAKSK